MREDVGRLSYAVSGERQIRATALGRGTQGVPDVGRMVASQFHIAFPHRIWVAGVVGAAEHEPDGTLRFLVHAATGEDDFSLPCAVPGDTLPAVRELLQRTHDADLEDVVRRGRLARVGGLLRFDAPRGSVVLTVSELDPTPTARELEDARDDALRAVAAAGLADTQRRHLPRTAPLDVAVVAGFGNDALERVREQLTGSRFDVEVRAFPVALSSADPSARLAQAVRAAAQDNDIVLLVRDEGRPLGLAWFDALDVAEAVADAPVPVLTGLGGTGTRTACDEVAFRALTTAEAAASWVLDRLGQAERALVHLEDDIETELGRAGERCRLALEDVQADIDAALRDAVPRSEQARRRHRRLLVGGTALLAVLLVVLAVVAGTPLLLAGLAVPVLLLGGVLLWWQRAGTRGSGHMGVRDDDFTQVLSGLRSVRDELASTSSPERVGVLRELAQELVADGRALLHRHLDPPSPSSPSPQSSSASGRDEPPALDGAATPEDPVEESTRALALPADQERAGGAAPAAGSESAAAAPSGREDGPDAATEVVPRP
jgi:exonuclease VII large subunit